MNESMDLKSMSPMEKLGRPTGLERPIISPIDEDQGGKILSPKSDRYNGNFHKDKGRTIFPPATTVLANEWLSAHQTKLASIGLRQHTVNSSAKVLAH